MAHPVEVIWTEHFRGPRNLTQAKGGAGMGTAVVERVIVTVDIEHPDTPAPNWH